MTIHPGQDRRSVTGIADLIGVDLFFLPQVISQNAPVPFGVPSPVGPSYPTCAMQR